MRQVGTPGRTGRKREMRGSRKREEGERRRKKKERRERNCHFSVFFYLGKVGFNGSHNLSDMVQEELSKSHFAA